MLCRTQFLALCPLTTGYNLTGFFWKHCNHGIPLVKCSCLNAVLFSTVRTQRTHPPTQSMVDPHSGTSLSCQLLLSSLNMEYILVGFHPCPSEPNFYKNWLCSVPRLPCLKLCLALNQGPMATGWIKWLDEHIIQYNWLQCILINALGRQRWDT